MPQNNLGSIFWSFVCMGWRARVLCLSLACLLAPGHSSNDSFYAYAYYTPSCQGAWPLWRRKRYSPMCTVSGSRATPRRGGRDVIMYSM